MSFQLFQAEANQVPPVRTLKFALIDFPPYYIINGGKIQGSMVEKIYQMINDAGFKPEPYPLPLKRIPQELAAGKIDLWIGVAEQPVLKEGAFIGKMVVLKLRLSTWSLGQNIKISSLEDFKKHPVALITPFSYGTLAEKIKAPQSGIKYFEAKDINQAYQILANGRADLLLQFDDLMELWLKENPEKILRKNAYDELPCYIMISKKTPDAAEILKRLEKALKAIDQHSGENEALKQ